MVVCGVGKKAVVMNFLRSIFDGNGVFATYYVFW